MMLLVPGAELITWQWPFHTPSPGYHSTLPPGNIYWCTFLKLSPFHLVTRTSVRARGGAWIISVLLSVPMGHTGPGTQTPGLLGPLSFLAVPAWQDGVGALHWPSEVEANQGLGKECRRTARDNGKHYLQPECRKPPLPPPSPTDNPMSSNDKVITFLLFFNRIQMRRVCSLQADLMALVSRHAGSTRLNAPSGCGGTSHALENLGLTLPEACYLTY